MSEYDNLLNAVCDGEFERINDILNAVRPSFSINQAFETCYEDIMKFLRSKKAAIKAFSRDRTKSSFYTAIKQGHAKIVKHLLDHRVTVNRQFRGKINKLLCEYQKTLELFVESDEIKVDKANYDLFDNALMNGYINIIQDFLDYGIDVNKIYNSKYDKCCTALHRAAQGKQVEIAKLLINHGADVNIENDYGKTALFYAIKNVDYDTVKLLLENGAHSEDPDILHTAIIEKSKSIIELLIQHGIDINIKNQCGRSALHFVTVSKVQRRFRPRFMSIDNTHRVEITKLLLNNGANIEARTKSGIRPLHAAALKGFPEIAEILLQNGARVDVPILGKRTALFFAAYNAYGRVVEVLLKYGADINYVDDAGRTALDMAYTSGGIRFAMVRDESGTDMDIVKRYTYSLENCQFESDLSDYDHYDVSFYYGYREKTTDILEKHIMKLIAANLELCSEVLESFERTGSIRHFKKECKKELKKMKGVIVVNNITVYDLLKYNLNQLATLIRNMSTLEAIECYDYSLQFPLYKAIILGRVRKAIERGEYLSEGHQLLEALLSSSITLPPLPMTCTAQIVGYLDNLNISLLLQAFCRYRR